MTSRVLGVGVLLSVTACFDPALEAILVDRRVTPDMSRDTLDVSPDPPDLSRQDQTATPPCAASDCVLWSHTSPDRWVAVSPGSGDLEPLALELSAPGVVQSFVMTPEYVFVLMLEMSGDVRLHRCQRPEGACTHTLEDAPPRALAATSVSPSGVVALREDGVIQGVRASGEDRLEYGVELLALPASLAAQASAVALDRAEGVVWALLPAMPPRAQDLIARVAGEIKFLETGMSGLVGVVATTPDVLWVASEEQGGVVALDASSGALLEVFPFPEPISALSGFSSPSP